MSATPSFLSYEPVELTFGTSGLRGLVEDMTDLEVYINVKGALLYLAELGELRGSSVLLGGDLRPSTPRILRAAMRAILDCGYGVEYAGALPTPALIHHGIETGRPSVMVTGSHIPFDRNGLKLATAHGEVLKSDERGILLGAELIREEEYRKTALTSDFDQRGMLKLPPVLPKVDRTASHRYVRRYVAAFGPHALAGMRVAFFQHSAVGRVLIPEILTALGAVVVPFGRSETFVAIDTEDVSDGRLAELERAVDSLGMSVDAIVSTDGDSDRPLLIAVDPVGPKRLRFLSGDLLGAITAHYLGVEKAAVPISANDGIDRYLGERGIELHKTRIGSPYVIAAMQAFLHDHPTARVAGWEANGGFLLGSDAREGLLGALPTRDAVLPIVANLAAATEARSTLQALWSSLPPRYGRSGLIDGVPTELSAELFATLTPASRVTSIALDGDARRSTAGPAWLARKTLLERFFSPTLGFGEIVHIDILDGLRLSFSNGDVAHLRRSGNAPQLRIYATANRQGRADAIVSLFVSGPRSIGRRLLRLQTRQVTLSEAAELLSA